MPQEWADDDARRKKAHVPKEVAFTSKPQIALEQIASALAAGAPRGVVLTDAAYGYSGAFREGLTRMGLAYAVGVPSHATVWPPGLEPEGSRDAIRPGSLGSAKAWSGCGRCPTRLRRDAQHRPASVKELAPSLPASAWRDIAWREGSNDALSSHLAAVRLRSASEDFKRAEPNDMEWLLVEWPKGKAEPSKNWFSALSDDTPLETLVDITKLRWRIERDYQELESELGLAHYEGARVAWLSPPRDALHRRLWFSDPRESDDSPLSCQNQLIIPKLTA